MTWLKTVTSTFMPLGHLPGGVYGRQWGLHALLPEFDARHAAQVEPTRGMMALLMLHDVDAPPIWCNSLVVNEALASVFAPIRGYTDADFIPYFDPTPPVTTSMRDVYANAYKRLDGRVLLVIGNLSKEDREGEIQINSQKAGHAACEDHCLARTSSRSIRPAAGCV